MEKSENLEKFEGLEGAECSPKEVIRKSVTGDDMHMVPFKKETLERESGVDQKPSSDNLGEFRHTKQYEDSVEKEHVKKHLPIEKLESISKPFVAKIDRIRKFQSKTDDLLLLKSPRNLANKKRRHSINKKSKNDLDDFMKAAFQVQGTSPHYHTGNILPVGEDPFESKFHHNKF